MTGPVECTHSWKVHQQVTACNTKYLYLVQHSEAQWTQDDEKKPVNQDGVVIPLYWMGNLVCSNRALQGVLIDAA